MESEVGVFGSDNEIDEIKEVKRSQRRPKSKYDPAMDEIAYKLALLGLNSEAMAKFFGVVPKTIDKWTELFPEFKIAIERGREVADSNVANSLYNRAIGCSVEQEKVIINPSSGEVHRTTIVENLPADITAAKFWLTNRQRGLWSNTDKVEVTGANRAPIVIEFVRPGEENKEAPVEGNEAISVTECEFEQNQDS
jgi:hypothetical protein